jgi:hypothetical protein
LVWTRGPNFPLSSLDGRLDVPALPVAACGGAVSAAYGVELGNGIGQVSTQIG